MTDVPRGKYIGNWLSASPGDEADHFIRCPVCDGWIDCRDLLRSSSMKARSHTCTGSTAMRGAQFELRIDGTPRSYRDRKDYAMEAARLVLLLSARCLLAGLRQRIVRGQGQARRLGRSAATPGATLRRLFRLS